jgi:hypothetical protein
MAVRDTMADLITRTRRMIGDTSGTPVFDDQAIQDALDRYMQDVRLYALRPQERITGGGVVSFLEYFAPWGDWEAGATIQTHAFVDLTEPTDYSADYLAGKWTMAVSQWPNVWLSGQTYDCNLAASELLQEWAAKTALAYDYSQNGQQFIRSQQSKALLALSADYARRGRVTMGTIRRSDTRPAGGWR